MKHIFFAVALVVAGFSYAGGVPLCAEERDALAFLDYVTGPLPAAEEENWWHIGASAQRITALAISHGASFRTLAFEHPFVVADNSVGRTR